MDCIDMIRSFNYQRSSSQTCDIFTLDDSEVTRRQEREGGGEERERNVRQVHNWQCSEY